MRGLTVGIVWLFGAGLAVAAVQVRTIDGRNIQGELSAISADALSLSGGDVSLVPIGDVEAVEFLPPPRPNQESIILIDNTGSFADRQQSGKIKLRAGQHQLGVIYFTAEGASSFRLEMEGPGLGRKQIPPETMFHVEDFRTVKRSKGFDSEGFRLPDQVDDPQPKVSFRVQEWAHATDVQTFNHLRLAPVTGTGTHLGFNLRPKHKQTTNFALVFQTIVNMAQEGEYTFYLNTAGQAVLCIGSLPLEAAITTRPHEEGDWVARLRGEGELTGPAAEWSDDHLTIGVKINEKTEPVNVPLGAVAELWRYPATSDPSKFDRAGEPSDADSVYAKSSTGEAQRVTGRVLGLSSDKLRFEFGGAERTIALERVQGIVWASAGAPPVDRTRAQGVVWLAGGQKLPGLVKSIKPGEAVVTTSWGTDLTFVAGHVVREELRGGRLVRLSSLEPSAVKETSYLDRVIPWQRDRSLLGSSLTIGDRSYGHGVSQHSQSRLEFDLQGNYERFQADVGLLTPDGAKGNVNIRVSADRQVLLEKTAVTAKDGPTPIDLDVTGRKKLQLEVDFGEQFDVGDHVGWGNARLLRSRP